MFSLPRPQRLTPAVLRGMGVEDLTKTGEALEELRSKGA